MTNKHKKLIGKIILLSLLPLWIIPFIVLYSFYFIIDCIVEALNDK